MRLPDHLLIATTNPDKLREIRVLLTRVPLLALADMPPVREPEETGETFDANARLKALYYDDHLCHGAERRSGATWTVAEDSGFIVDALDGEPGVRSARFVRPDASYPERFDEIYRRLTARDDRPRSARFACALAVASEGRILFETTGTIEGLVADAPHGTGGFGYDPVFHYPPYGKTLAEVSQEEKLRVAHRGQAFRALERWLGGLDR